VSVRKATLPTDTKSLHSLLKYIDLSIYPEHAEIENPDDQWFVYEEKEEIIGCVAARKNSGEIRHIAVVPNHRRKGIGTKLAKCAIEFLRSVGCPIIWTQVRVKNEESQGLFEKLNFMREAKPIRSRKNPEVKLFKYVRAL
jgi:ribosomal protein S18 acetylase RimI-like enzyme